jgi:hypothetical protein
MSDFKSETEARAFGRRIKKTLKGKGWKMSVWNNLGWHVHWTLGRLTLTVSFFRGETKYSTLISDVKEEPGSGASHWARSFSHKDPNVVVQKDLKYVMGIAKNALGGLNDIKEMLAGGVSKKKREQDKKKLEDYAVCQDCENVFLVPEDNDFATIPDLNERVLPGEVMPVCECPVCKSLAHTLTTTPYVGSLS